MGKFINPFTDVGFKRIFGQEFSKSLLLDFLNNLLKGERHITGLQLLDKEQAAEYDGDRSPIYDVYTCSCLVSRRRQTTARMILNVGFMY